MNFTTGFLINSICFGVGLAMDAFSVSMANGLNEPDMTAKRMGRVAGVFALFQIAMPLIGWLFVSSIASIFSVLQRFIPWIAFLLLLYIGGKMLIDGFKNEEAEKPAVGLGALLLQGVATSIDALSVGFTISNYSLTEALTESVIIGIVTFVICIAGLLIGKTFGTKLSGKATILGGLILIGIGIEILITGII